MLLIVKNHRTFRPSRTGTGVLPRFFLPPLFGGVFRRLSWRIARLRTGAMAFRAGRACRARYSAGAVCFPDPVRTCGSGLVRLRRIVWRRLLPERDRPGTSGGRCRIRAGSPPPVYEKSRAFRERPGTVFADSAEIISSSESCRSRTPRGWTHRPWLPRNPRG